MMMLLIATRNLHKVEEIRNILGSDFDYRTVKDFPDAPAVLEDAPDFAGNATKKALALANWIPHASRIMHRDEGAWILADDSGLEVDALGGAPGVHSARFASLSPSGAGMGNSSDAANNAKLLRLLADVPLEKRTARFRCVIAVAPLIEAGAETREPVCYANEAELRTELFDGVCEGHIAFEPSGSGGFGYDPLFIPLGYDQSFAELGEDVKNRLSHRAKALQKLKLGLEHWGGRPVGQP